MRFILIVLKKIKILYIDRIKLHDFHIDNYSVGLLWITDFVNQHMFLII